MMLLDYYGLNEQPFGVTPDPRYLFFSEGHREALAAIYYAIEERRGFSALVAKPGMGKTTLLFRLLESLQESARTAFLFQAGQDSRDFLDSLVRDLGIAAKSTDLPALHDALNTMLVKEMEENRRVVVVIDEAQNLTEQMLEQVRLLSNFETPAAKMIHIVLAGQPGLADKLGSPALTQLRQRVGSVAHLPALNLKEITQYIDHRLSAAGYRGPQVFASDALENIAAVSEGIPRNINSICFQSLSLGFVYQKRQIDTAIVREVSRDLELRKETQTRHTGPKVTVSPTTAGTRARAPRTLSPAAATWPAFPAAAQAADFGYYGMPHSSERKALRSSLGMIAFLLVFLPLITFGALTKAGIVDSNAVIDRFMNVVRHSDPQSARAPTAPATSIPSLLNSPQKSEGNISEADPPAAVPPSSGAPPSGSPGPAMKDNRAAPPPADASKPVLIRLTRKQTVNDLATEYFGTSDRSAVQLILSQNPKVRHAYEMLPAGTQLVLPAKSTINNQGAEPNSEQANKQEKSEARSVAQVTRKYGRVRVPRDETLFQFALEELGKGDWETVRRIRASNPQIRDPYEILEKGQWVKLPEEIAQR
jgi:type II secretory pathway predicted ATPase ExeA/phage tail protein X